MNKEDDQFQKIDKKVFKNSSTIHKFIYFFLNRFKVRLKQGRAKD